MIIFLMDVVFNSDKLFAVNFVLNFVYNYDKLLGSEIRFLNGENVVFFLVDGLFDSEELKFKIS